METPCPGELTFPILQANLADVAVVTDAEVAEAMRYAFGTLKLVVEPGGSVGLAALLAGKIALRPGGTVGLVLSGGNIDPELFAQMLRASSRLPRGRRRARGKSRPRPAEQGEAQRRHQRQPKAAADRPGRQALDIERRVAERTRPAAPATGGRPIASRPTAISASSAAMKISARASPTRNIFPAWPRVRSRDS